MHDLDFVRGDGATGGHWNKARIGIAWLALIVTSSGCAFALWQRHELLVQRDAAAAAFALSAAGQDGSPHKRRSAPADPESEAAVRRIALDLRRPWEPMLDALQAALSADVMLVRAQPESDPFRLRVSGLADDGAAFLAFATRLRADPSWRVVEPLSQALQAESVPGGKPLSFQLALEWRQR